MSIAAKKRILRDGPPSQYITYNSQHRKNMSIAQQLRDRRTEGNSKLTYGDIQYIVRQFTMLTELPDNFQEKIGTVSKNGRKYLYRSAFIDCYSKKYNVSSTLIRSVLKINCEREYITI
jgi:hypothetical protein